jgi:hypothetical protein
MTTGQTFCKSFSKFGITATFILPPIIIFIPPFVHPLLISTFTYLWHSTVLCVKYFVSCANKSVLNWPQTGATSWTICEFVPLLCYLCIVPTLC